MACIEQSLAANSVGLQNVYNEFEKYKISDITAKIDNINLRLDHYERDKNVEDFDLDIQSYPMNIRIGFNIRTNFGQIIQSIDFPPCKEYEIHKFIGNVYNRLLNTLFEEHEKRSGKHIGEPGCKEWFDKNGKTIIKLEPIISKR